MAFVNDNFFRFRAFPIHLVRDEYEDGSLRVIEFWTLERIKRFVSEEVVPVRLTSFHYYPYTKSFFTNIYDTELKNPRYCDDTKRFEFLDKKKIFEKITIEVMFDELVRLTNV